jgi:acid phosphatase
MSRLALTRRRALAALGAAAFAPLSRTWAAQEAGALAFLAVGDWGREGQFHQREVAQRMGESARELNAKFVISVGDNFYEDGVTGLSDPAWKASFEDVYDAPSLQVPWCVALGNHDYRGDSQAQVDYSKTSPRWRLPARWHAFSERAPDGASLEVFVLDTSPMIQAYHAPDSKVVVTGQDTDAQLAWFEQRLAASTADWKIVVGHHPVYSGAPSAGAANGKGGEGGGGGSPDLQARIDPILQRHRIPLYLNGHDHDLQHVHKGVTDYVCTGAGSKMRDQCNMGGSDFCSLQSGFVACTVTRGRLRVTYRDWTGADLHVIDIPRSS